MNPYDLDSEEELQSQQPQPQQTRQERSGTAVHRPGTRAKVVTPQYAPQPPVLPPAPAPPDRIDVRVQRAVREAVTYLHLFDASNPMQRGDANVYQSLWSGLQELKDEIIMTYPAFAPEMNEYYVINRAFETMAAVIGQIPITTDVAWTAVIPSDPASDPAVNLTRWVELAHFVQPTIVPGITDDVLVVGDPPDAFAPDEVLIDMLRVSALGVQYSPPQAYVAATKDHRLREMMRGMEEWLRRQIVGPQGWDEQMVTILMGPIEFIPQVLRYLMDAEDAVGFDAWRRVSIRYVLKAKRIAWGAMDADATEYRQVRDALAMMRENLQAHEAPSAERVWRWYHDEYSVWWQWRPVVQYLALPVPREVRWARENQWVLDNHTRGRP